MKLDDCIRKIIWSSPKLYRSDTYEDSKLLVLDHLFLTSANGYEWNSEGYLSEVGAKVKKYGKESFSFMPKDYFDKDLVCFDVYTEDIPKIEAALADKFYYFLKNSKEKMRKLLVESENINFINEYTIDSTQWWAVHQDKMRVWKTPYCPSKITDQSAIKRIADRKVKFIHFDWLKGCIDIAEEAKRYYSRWKGNYGYKMKADESELEAIDKFLEFSQANSFKE